MRVLGIVAMFVALTLSGCAGEDAGADDKVQACNPQVEDCSDLLGAGKGAIAGLLVDDRFRPIELTDDPTTEFQTTGFVLLQQTGEQVQTTENGEFLFVDLEPGEYTIRVTAEGHEAVPRTVEVVEREFAESTVIARRTSSEGSYTITESYAAFSPCFINFVALSYTADCTGDRSGDTAQLGIQGRLLNDTGDVTWVVGEALFNQVPSAGAAYDLVMRESIGEDYSAAVTWDSRYLKLHLQNNSISPDPEPQGNGGFKVWNTSREINMLMFGRGYLSEELRSAYEPVYDFLNSGTVPCQDIPFVGICVNEIPMRRGAGGTLGNEAQFLLTIFIGEPEVDPLQYCGICAPED